LQKKRIFIVEDSGVIQLELRKILEGLGYEIGGTATTGEEAVAGCIQDRPDLILMDVVLPGGINGIEASRRISREIDVPVIFTTAYSDQDIIDEVQKSFPFGFVIKPYREKDLLVAIETAFTRYEYEKKLEESERKYKSLFEGTSDIILILDENLRVLSANRAVLNYLNIRPADIVSKNFLDLLYVTEKKNVQSIILIRDKLDHFLHDRKAIDFKTAFQSKFNNVAVEMNLRMESISIPSGNLIMCRASRDIDDEMMKLFVSDEQELAMGNQLFLVGDVAYRLTRDLRKYLDSDTTELVRLSLIEMIINAIEHGNLEISYQEKSAALQVGSYVDFIARRQEDPRYKKRLVRIKYRINPCIASYTITDDGGGFDHSSFMKNEISDTNINLKPHGRGLYMSRKIFDDVIYNEKGNSVTVVKKFKGA
jgi:CheY-like chemotaxis protein